MSNGLSLYIEVDKEAYWNIVDNVPYDTDVFVIYDIEGVETGTVILSNISEVANMLSSSGYISEYGAALANIDYNVITVINKDTMKLR